MTTTRIPVLLYRGLVAPRVDWMGTDSGGVSKRESWICSSHGIEDMVGGKENGLFGSDRKSPNL